MIQEFSVFRISIEVYRGLARPGKICEGIMETEGAFSSSSAERKKDRDGREFGLETFLRLGAVFHRNRNRKSETFEKSFFGV